MADAVAVVLWIVVTAYAVLGGADFGAGFWDLVAGGDRRGERPRALIDHSIGPVWEANHVWLIFALVVLWTAFPEAFASVTLTLFVPLALVALGIVLRGASFAFRKSLVGLSQRRILGAIFALSSVLVPYGMGAVAGAIASGEVPAGGEAGEPWAGWGHPASARRGLLRHAPVALVDHAEQRLKPERILEHGDGEQAQTHGKDQPRHEQVEFGFLKQPAPSDLLRGYRQRRQDHEHADNAQRVGDVQQ